MSCVGKDTEMRPDKHAPSHRLHPHLGNYCEHHLHRNHGEGSAARPPWLKRRRRSGRRGGRREARWRRARADWRGRVVWDEMEVARQGELRRWRRREGRPGPSSCRSPFRQLTEILTPSIFLPCRRSNCHWPAH